MFLKLGRFISWALIILGSARAFVGFYVAYFFEDPAAYEWATARYLGSSTSGEAIDRGLIMIALGVFFGLLVRIAKKRTA